MLILAKATMAMMIGFILAIILGLILIPILRKFHIGQSVSIYLQEKHKKKNGIPTMGGLIFIITTIVTVIILLIMKKIEFSENLFILMYVFVAYGILGFIDDYLIVVKKNNKGLTEIQKLLGQLFIALGFYIIYMKSGHPPVLEVNAFGLNIDINFGAFYILFIMFIMVASSNAVNITDGLDGLAGGLSIISFLCFALIAWNSKWIVGYEDMAIFCFILIGSLMGFLMFNTYPAKIFMGDTGSLAIGGALGAVAILTGREFTLILVAGVFVIETLSCIIQILSVRLTGKKVFLMTPLHHHFEKLGWQENDIVKSFWVIGLLFAMIAIAFGVWI